MMKCGLHYSEWWPVLTICKKGDSADDKNVEFTEDEIREFIAALKSFRAWQIKLRDRFGLTNERNYDMMGGEIETVENILKLP